MFTNGSRSFGFAAPPTSFGWTLASVPLVMAPCPCMDWVVSSHGLFTLPQGPISVLAPSSNWLRRPLARGWTSLGVSGFPFSAPTWRIDFPEHGRVQSPSWYLKINGRHDPCPKTFVPHPTQSVPRFFHCLTPDVSVAHRKDPAHSLARIGTLSPSDLHQWALASRLTPRSASLDDATIAVPNRGSFPGSRARISHLPEGFWPRTHHPKLAFP
jgi:hypothetical protein